MCFYNGEAEREDRVVLDLKDAFEREADIDVRVTMLNVNYGRNRALMEACKPLRDYAWFVDAVRHRQATLNDLDAAVDAALNEMPEESALKAFMTANRAEVKRMCITEYNEVKTLADEREEGRMEGVIETLLNLVRKGLISEERAAEEAHMSVSQFREQAKLA
ncbi:MAG: hypothetical protein IJI71_16825 [Clostridia bacterium]|nr:hypothetical protein [Clostridia bacterium]